MMPTRTRRIRGSGNICRAHDVSPTTLAFWVRDTQETFEEGFVGSLKVMKKTSSTNLSKELIRYVLLIFCYKICLGLVFHSVSALIMTFPYCDFKPLHCYLLRRSST
jgi:hypothetical protein